MDSQNGWNSKAASYDFLNSSIKPGNGALITFGDELLGREF
jgi:hypothetical protein